MEMQSATITTTATTATAIKEQGQRVQQLFSTFEDNKDDGDDDDVCDDDDDEKAMLSRLLMICKYLTSSINAEFSCSVRGITTDRYSGRKQAIANRTQDIEKDRERRIERVKSDALMPLVYFQQLFRQLFLFEYHRRIAIFF